MKNRKLTLSAVALVSMVTGSGCFQNQSNQQQQNPTDAPRAELIQALDAHATQLVNGMNKVIIEGDFIRALSQTPPSPIPVESEDEVRKAMEYLLSNASLDQSGKVVTYRPDSRVCSEIFAQNDPQSCIAVMNEVRFVQTITGPGTGSVQLMLNQFQPLQFAYSGASLGLDVDLIQVRGSAARVNEILAQSGVGDGKDRLPTVASGKLQAVSQRTGTESSLSLSVTEAISISGSDENDKPLKFDIQKAQDVAKFTLKPLLGEATLSLNVPAAEARFMVRDDSLQYHDIAIHFPGGKGSFTLSNPSKKLMAQALSLVGGQGSIDLDGSEAIRATLSELSAELAVGNGPALIRALEKFEARLELNGQVPGVINRSGVASLSIANGTTVQGRDGSEQLEILSGEIRIEGIGDLAGLVDAQAGSCIQGDDDAALFLETVACQ